MTIRIGNAPCSWGVEFASDPPSARPLACRYSTSWRKPNVRACEISSLNDVASSSNA